MQSPASIVAVRFIRFLSQILVGVSIMVECLKTFVITTRLVKLGKNRIGFYIQAKDREMFKEFIGKKVTLTVCIHVDNNGK